MLKRVKKVSIYVGNHGKKDGIEDYLGFMSEAMTKRGIDIQISSDFLPDAVNVVIDEFTNYLENRRIECFKKEHPQTPLVFVLTEFVERKWGVISFNNFGGVFDAADIAFFDFYLRAQREDLGAIDLFIVIKAAIYFPLLLMNNIPYVVKFCALWALRRRIQNPIARFLSTRHRLIYLHMRYLGLSENARYADAFFASHEKIGDSISLLSNGNGVNKPFLGVIYPELDVDLVLKKIMINKKLFVEVTGSVSKFRKKYIERINRNIRALGAHHVFGFCLAIPFSVDERNKVVERGAYSLHPPQTRNWPYSSPTRIYRALAVDFNLPVITHYFGQNPAEDLCYLYVGPESIVDMYEMYKNRDDLMSFLAPKINKYSEIVCEKNDKAWGLIKDLWLS